MFRTREKTTLGKFAEINRRYAHPKIQMTPAVKIALVALRVYLVVLIALLVVKFVTLV